MTAGWNAIPLPSPWRVRQLPLGERRSRQIRALYAERCSPAEIAAHLQIGVDEVRRTLHRPGREH
ncbi:hypothetical protein SAMN05421681_10610 [Lysobacter enzymogenes]|nr:hypothetical protein SAMN05421681_10610 [Lysobacter enzymogenes]